MSGMTESVCPMSTLVRHDVVIFSVVTKAVDAETETKTEAVYLKTETEAQGNWPILLTVLSSGAVLAQKFYGALPPPPAPSSFFLRSPKPKKYELYIGLHLKSIIMVANSVMG